MCRNIKILFNFDPKATTDETKSAALQFVRKVSGFQKVSKVNEKAFNKAVDNINQEIRILLSSLETTQPPRNRELEKKRAHERSLKRFGPNNKA